MRIRDHSFFGFFPGEIARDLMKVTRSIRFRKGDLVFQEGDPSDSIYLVASGSVLLRKRADEGQFLDITTLHEGDFLGELGVLDGSGRSAQARANGLLRVGKIPGADLIRALERSPLDTSLQIFSRVSENLRNTNHMFVEGMVRKEKLTLVGEMADSIIHDFRSPFTTIRLACERIAMQGRDPETERLCGIIESQIRRMSVMVNEVLEFSHGEPVLNAQPVRLPELFSRFSADNQLFLLGSTVELVTEPLDITFVVDADKLMRLFQNLLNNAVEALDGRAGRVILSARRRGRKTVEIRMEDNGPGIPDEIRDSLMEPFVTRGKRGGTGLGLAVAESIVRSHGGTLSFVSDNRKGTTFIISLPVRSKQAGTRVAAKSGSGQPFLTNEQVV